MHVQWSFIAWQRSAIHIKPTACTNATRSAAQRVPALVNREKRGPCVGPDEQFRAGTPCGRWHQSILSHNERTVALVGTVTTASTDHFWHRWTAFDAGDVGRGGTFVIIDGADQEKQIEPQTLRAACQSLRMVHKHNHSRTKVAHFFDTRRTTNAQALVMCWVGFLFRGGGWPTCEWRGKE